MASSPFTFNFPTLNSPSLVDVTTLAKKLDPTACGTPLNLDAVTGFMDDIKLKLDLPSIDLKSALPDLDGFKDELMGALGDLKPNLPDLGDSFKDAISELQTLAGPEFAKLKAELQEKWKDVIPDLDNILDSTPDLTSLLKGTVDAIDICSVVPEINAKFETVDGVAVATEITKQAQNALTPDKTAEAVEKFTEQIQDARTEIVEGVNKALITVDAYLTATNNRKAAVAVWLDHKKAWEKWMDDNAPDNWRETDYKLKYKTANEIRVFIAKWAKSIEVAIAKEAGIISGGMSAEKAWSNVDKEYENITNYINQRSDEEIYLGKAGTITKIDALRSALEGIKDDIILIRKYELQ